jgi:serine/threonine protein kinase
MIADQLIYRFQYIYLKYIIHRDIKLENFLININKNRNYIYVINLNIAAKYRPRRILTDTNLSNLHLLETARFTNINKYFGIGKLSNRGIRKR